MTFSNTEGGLLGAAILAGVGAGLYPDETSGARCCLRVARTFSPDPALAERYNALFDLFKDLHDRFQSPFDRLARLP